MKIATVAAALLGAAAPLVAQQPDTAQARRDSLALVRELEGGAAADTSRRMSPRPQPVNPRMMPDISVIGDFLGDFSKESTQESGGRMNVREIELALGANVDPYFRADFILGVHDEDGIAIEEAYATALALPGSLQARVGRFHMPFGKQNTTHRAELHTLEYPWVIQRFLGEEAQKGTGLWVSRIMAPLGWYQELILTGTELVPGHTHDEPELVTEEPLSRDLSNLTFSARLRNYWDISEAANLELSGSAMTGKRAQPFEFGPLAPDPEVNAVAARQGLYGADLTFRWRPLEQGLYRSLIVQGEFFHQVNETNPAAASPGTYVGPVRDYSGAYGFARWQLTRRWHLGGRYDWVEDPATNGSNLTAASGYLQWFPSEFSKVNFGFERVMQVGSALNRFLVQATFAIGPHRPHPF